jgi:hypothetical protein
MKEMFHFQNGIEEDRERFITVLGWLTSDERFQLLAFCTGTPSLGNEPPCKLRSGYTELKWSHLRVK